MRSRQNVHRFSNDIFKCIFMNENVRRSIKIPVKFVPKGPINNIPALVQIMAWRRSGHKPLSEPIIVYWRIYASLGLNKLMVNYNYLGHGRWGEWYTKHIYNCNNDASYIMWVLFKIPTRRLWMYITIAFNNIGNLDRIGIKYRSIKRCKEMWSK